MSGAAPAAAPARDALTPAETVQLLALLDAVNTMVKHVSLFFNMFFSVHIDSVPNHEIIIVFGLR